MIGDQGQGTPRQIVLTAQPKGDAPPGRQQPGSPQTTRTPMPTTSRSNPSRSRPRSCATASLPARLPALPSKSCRRCSSASAADAAAKQPAVRQGLGALRGYGIKGCQERNDRLTAAASQADHRQLRSHRSLFVANSLLSLHRPGRRCGRSNANPARRIPYAARMPNAIEPIAAQINITKFNKSVIDPA